MPFPFLAVAARAALPALRRTGPKLMGKAGGALRSLLGGRAARVGAVAVGTGAAFEAGGRVVRGRRPGLQYDPQTGQRINPRTGLPFRKRRRGVTGADIRGAQRVARLVSAFGFKPKFARRKKRRGF